MSNRIQLLGLLGLSSLNTLPTFAQEEPPIPERVAEAVKQAITLYKAGKFAEALALLETRIKELGEGITADEALSLRLCIADAHFALGETARRRADYQEAITHYEVAYEIDKAERPSDATTALSYMGLSYFNLGKNSKALDIYNQALLRERQIGDKYGEAFILTGIGKVYDSLGERSKAVEFFNQALLIIRKVGDKRGEAVMLMEVGEIYKSRGEMPTALEFLKQALPLYRQIGAKEGEAIALTGIGSLYSSLGEFSKSLESYSKALAIIRQTGIKEGEATMLTNIGTVYSDLGEKYKALEFHNRALQLYRQVGDKQAEAITLQKIGTVHSHLGEKPKALEFFNRALQLYRQIGNKAREASILTSIGFIYDSPGEEFKALEFFNQALPIIRQFVDKEDEASTLTGIGRVYRSLGEMSKALEFYSQALALYKHIGDKNEEANTLKGVMRLWQDIKPDRRSLPIAALCGKKAVSLKQQIRAGTQSLDRQRQQTLAQEGQALSFLLITLLQEQGREHEALQVYLLQERQNARESGTTTKPITPDLTLQEAKAAQEYDQLTAAISTIVREIIPLEQRRELSADQKAEKERLAARMQRAQGAFLAFLNNLPSMFNSAPAQKVESPRLVPEFHQAFQTLQAQTKQASSTILSMVFDDKIAYLVVKNGKSILRTTPIKQVELDKIIGKFRTALTTIDRDGRPIYNPKPLAQQLYKILVTPIEKDIIGCQQVFWALDGKLRYIPIAALHDGKQYLVEKPQRHSLISVESVATLAKAPSKNKNLLACATGKAHTTDGSSFEALPGVANELKAIQPGKRLTESAFTRQGFLSALKAKPSIVHLATHFALKPGNLYNSFLVLGDGNPLRLSDFNDLPDDLFAGVDLLTLSACDTASGTTTANGAELESFGYLAQRKGAAAVLSTLWPVNDASTAALMAKFYSGLGKAGSKLGKVEALRRAQCALLRGEVKPASYRRSPNLGNDLSDASLPPYRPNPKLPCEHPYYWAPFVLLGNPR